MPSNQILKRQHHQAPGAKNGPGEGDGDRGSAVSVHLLIPQQENRIFILVELSVLSRCSFSNGTSHHVQESEKEAF